MTGRRAALIFLVMLVAAPGWAQRPVVSSTAEQETEVPEPLADSEAAGDDGGRIIKGRNARPNELPFQVQIHWREPDPATGRDVGVPDWQRAHRCGGALIAPEWVLTAAHCFFPGKKSRGARTLEAYPAEWFGVRAGAVAIVSQASGAVDVPVSEVFIHPGYVPCKDCPPVGRRAQSREHRFLFTHDIALVRLARPMPTTPAIRPVRLFSPAGDGPMVPQRQVVASGWGLASNDSAREEALLGEARERAGNSSIRARPEPILQVAALETVPCTGEGVLPTHFCAGGRDGADTCMGDSGGPLVLQRPDGPALVGITSRRPIGEQLCGQGVTRAKIETRYSRVDADHAAWIAAVMAGSL